VYCPKYNGTVSNQVTVVSKDSFPFLDMELFWNGQNLNFCVHLKENQELKYLNKGSAHTNACYIAILEGVLKHLAKLTSCNNDNKNIKMNALYPKHAEALKKAGLAPNNNIWPTLGEVLDKKSEFNTNKKKKQKKHGQGKRSFV